MAAEADPRFLRDAERHARMRAAAANRAGAFATERIVPQYEALYEEAMVGNNRFRRP